MSLLIVLAFSALIGWAYYNNIPLYPPDNEAGSYSYSETFNPDTNEDYFDSYSIQSVIGKTQKVLLEVKGTNRSLVLPIDEIQYFTKIKDGLLCYKNCRIEPETLRLNLSEVYERLPNKGDFFKTRYELIHYRYVKEFISEKDTSFVYKLKVIMENDSSFSIPKDRAVEFKNALKSYISS